MILCWVLPEKIIPPLPCTEEIEFINQLTLLGVVLTRTAISWYPELVIFAVNILQPVKKAETPCVM